MASADPAAATPSPAPAAPARTAVAIATAVMAAALAVAPLVGIYPVFLMKALCFALFACAFNLLIGFGGLLSFGHAMFLGTAGYVSAHAAKVWGCAARARDPRRHRGRGAAGRRRRRARDPPPGHLLRDDHAGARADDLSSSACRRRSPHGEDGIQAVPRGKLFGVLDLVEHARRCTTSCSRSSSAASC